MQNHFRKLLTANHPEFKDIYDRAKKAQLILNDRLVKDAEALDWQGTIKRLTLDLEIEPDPNARLLLAQKLAVFKTTGEQLRAGAISTCAVFATVLDDYVRTMLARAKDAARIEQRADVEKEKAFFASVDMPHEPTSVSKRWRALIEQIDAYLAGLDTHAARSAMATPGRDMHCSAFNLFE